MIEQTGIVTESNDATLWVETHTVSGCSSCASGSCSSAVVSKLFGERRQWLQLPNSLAARPGDAVVIGIPEAVLVRASLSAYLLPLLALVGAALMGHLLGVGEGLQGLLGLAGLAAGFLLVRRLSGSGPHLQPRLLRLSATPPGGISVPVGMPGRQIVPSNGLPNR